MEPLRRVVLQNKAGTVKEKEMQRWKMVAGGWREVGQVVNEAPKKIVKKKVQED